MKDKSKEIAQAMIENVLGKDNGEYEPLRTIDEISLDELTNYVVNHYNGWSNNLQRKKSEVIPGLTFEEMYEKNSYGFNNTSFDIRYSFIEENIERRHRSRKKDAVHVLL